MRAVAEAGEQPKVQLEGLGVPVVAETEALRVTVEAMVQIILAEAEAVVLIMHQLEGLAAAASSYLNIPAPAPYQIPLIPWSTRRIPPT